MQYMAKNDLGCKLVAEREEIVAKQKEEYDKLVYYIYCTHNWGWGTP